MMMEKLPLSQIAACIGAECPGEAQISAISTDSREISPGCLFLALEGERFDGHDYIARALAEGAAYAVAMRPGDYPPGRVLLVRDTREALLQIAGLYRRRLDVRVVAVTGSVGKTTTRDMTACVLSRAYPTLCTEANLNNEIGLPGTILQMDAGHRAAVLEMGMDGPGQIRRMSLCARPDVGIITNVGVSHLEHFGSREGILAAKLEISEGIPDGGTLILCGDNDLLAGVRSDRLNILLYGVEKEGCAVRAREIRSVSTATTFTILYNNLRIPARIPCLGAHNVLGALAAFSAGVTLGIPPEEAAGALEGFSPTGMRQRIVDRGGCTVVEDCYNASPDSMRAALAVLRDYPGALRRIAVLSDMLELGALEVQAHREIGRMAAGCADLVFCTGPLARHYAEGAREAGGAETFYFDSKDALSDALCAGLREGDVAWFKASRGMRLEEVIQRLYKECPVCQ